MMDQSAIKAKLAAVEASFATLQAQSEAKRQEIETIEQELTRFQGEYRAWSSMLADRADPVTTITATPEEKKAKDGAK